MTQEQINNAAETLYPIKANAECFTAFIQGAKWVINHISTLPVDEIVVEVLELYKELKQEEELTKWNLKKMSPFVPNKCESCDRFGECYTTSGRMRELCKKYGANVVFKRKKQ